MATEKVVSYTDEQIETLTKMYLEANSVDTIAAALGKSARSVVAKLAQLGVYRKADKSKTSRVTKADMLATIEAKLEIEPGKLASMEKADKTAIETLLAALA